MTGTDLLSKAYTYLHQLAVEISNRSAGSPGNKKATALFADTAAVFGFSVETQPFTCIDWAQEGVVLRSGEAIFETFASPYTLGCQACAPLIPLSTLSELESTQTQGAILLLRGELTREQLMPKHFPFYNPESHQHIIHLLEGLEPQAIITATTRDLGMVGSQYPFPMIEDGDFDIPSAFMTEEEGTRLMEYAGQSVEVEIRARRIPSKGCNVIARKGYQLAQRVVLFAHIDARLGTPGANDNASGVVVLLLLAELLAGYLGKTGIELVAMNGEDDYSNPGEQKYLALNAGRFDDIMLGINLDDVGHRRGGVAYSLYGCSEEVTGLVHAALSAYPDLVPGEPWYQGDHGLFLMNEVPAMAVTAELLGELMAEYTHTEKDKPEIVDPQRLVTLAHALHDLLLRLCAGS